MQLLCISSNYFRQLLFKNFFSHCFNHYNRTERNNLKHVCWAKCAITTMIKHFKPKLINVWTLKCSDIPCAQKAQHMEIPLFSKTLYYWETDLLFGNRQTLVIETAENSQQTKPLQTDQLYLSIFSHQRLPFSNPSISLYFWHILQIVLKLHCFPNNANLCCWFFSVKNVSLV